MCRPGPGVGFRLRIHVPLISISICLAAGGGEAAQRGTYDAFLGAVPIFLEGFESGECSLWSASSSPLAAPDADEDLFGDELLPTVNCERPPGYVLEISDCDDQDPNVHPGAPELCNAIDDDCDDVVDGFDEACYSGPPATLNVGVCVAGISTCTGGQWGPCVGEVLPTPEVCNGLDDDCNGSVDDGIVPDTNPSCLSNTFLGSVAGDTGAEQLEATSFDEQFYRFTVREDSAASLPLLASVVLVPPPGVDFDLYLYCVSCGGVLAGSSTLPAGVTETVNVGRDDSIGDQTYDLIVEVRFVSATACGDWQLVVTGNVPTANRACN
jgi:hypothetical protein